MKYIRSIRFVLLILLLVSACQSSAPGTVATPESLGDHLLISETMAGIEDNNLYDYIELYNPTHTAIDLRGYALWYLLKEGDDEVLVHIWDESALVPPFGHYLIAQAGQDFGLTPDVTTSLALQPQRGGLWLTNPERDVEDSVGWGNAPAKAIEGRAAVPLKNGKSLARLPGGPNGNFTDSESNIEDFFIQASPDPQNTGSEPVPSGDQNLAFSITAPDSVPPGSEFSYTINLENRGETDLTGVSVSFLLPDGFDLKFAASEITLEGEWVFWDLPELAAGASVEKSIPILTPLTYSTQFLHSYFAQADNLALPVFGAPVITKIEGGSIPVATARELVGQEVVIEGVATMYVGGFFAGSGAKFYVTDGTAGIQVYVANAGNTLRVNIGDRVRVQGTITPYRSSLELIPANEAQVEVLEKNVVVPPPTEVTIGQFVSGQKELLGSLVSVEGALARVEEFSFSYELDLVDEQGKLVTAYLDKETGITIETIDSGDRYEVTGIVEGLDGYIRIYPRVQADLEKVYPDVLLISAEAPISIRPGEEFTIEYRVTNHTDQVISDAVVTATIPEGVSVVGISDEGVLGDGTVDWTFSEVTPHGGTAFVSLSVVPDEGVEVVEISEYQARYSGSEVALGETTYTFTRGTVPIWAIQGEGSRSPYTLRTVETEGIVVGVFPELEGFWIQESVSDQDPRTSAGIFVDTGALNPAVKVGNLVRVRGIVGEVFQQTQLTAGSTMQIEVLSEGNPLPEVALMDPPGDPELAKVYLESHEGMLVRVEAAVVVDPTNQYGEYAYVLAYHGIERIFRGANEGLILMADDGSTMVHDGAETLPYSVASGDLIANLQGPLAFSFGTYKIEPLNIPVIYAVERKLPVLPEVGGDQFSIMTWNVENLFDFVDPHPSSPPLPTVSEYKVQITKTAQTIVDAGLPTIIGLQEIENIGVLEDLADDQLIRQYGYIPVLIEGTDSRGIDVGYLVRGDRASVLEVVQYPAPEEITSRPPLMVKVEIAGLDAPIYLLNNHFTSLSGGEAATEPRRNAQAAWNVEVLEEILSGEPGGYAAVIGDLNSYYGSAPIKTLETSGLMHVFDLEPDMFWYTYVFEGVSQTLDHILLTESLADLALDVEVLHVNSDFPLPFVNDTSSMHTSDHDPVIVIFEIP